MRGRVAAVCIWGVMATSAVAQPQGGPCRGELVYVASSTRAPDQGVVGARLARRTGRLCSLGVVAVTPVPSWVTTVAKTSTLYATHAAQDGGAPSVVAYKVDRATGAINLLNAMPTGGAGATHLAVDQVSNTLFVAHFTSGHVSAHALRPDGAIELPAALVKGEGSGPRPNQAGPHAHAAVQDPTGKFLLVPDLGADRVFVYRFDRSPRQLTLVEGASYAAPAGSGPRHLAFHPNGKFAFLINEFTAAVDVFAWDASGPQLRHIQSIGSLSPDYKGVNTGAEIAVSPDGRHLYVSNRGEDSIVGFSIDAAAGRLELIQRVSSGGKTPRGFALHRRGAWMLVANQGADEVVVFRRDARNGKLTMTDHALAAPMAASVSFFGAP